MSRNAELAGIFREIAFVLQYQGDAWFKVRSYLSWADTLEAMDRPIEDFSAAELRAQPGVGKAIFEKTRDYLEKGTFNLLERVRKVGEDIRTMLTAGIPPAAVRQLETELSITSLDALRAAVKADPSALSALKTRQRNEVRAFLDQAADD